MPLASTQEDFLVRKGKQLSVLTVVYVGVRRDVVMESVSTLETERFLKMKTDTTVLYRGQEHGRPREYTSQSVCTARL